MTDEKKPREKPFTLYPMAFEEAVRKLIAAGPYKEKPTPKAGRLPAAERKRKAGTSRAARPSAKPKRGTARGR